MTGKSGVRGRLPALGAQTIRDLCLVSSHRHSVIPLITTLGVRLTGKDGEEHLDTRSARLAADTLAGLRPDMADGILRELREASIRMPTGIRRADLALLAHSGLDVPACLLLGICSDLASPRNWRPIPLHAPRLPGLHVHAVRHHDGSRTVVVDSAALSPDVLWSDGSVTVRGLPDTLLATLPGRPLAQAVSHPALDPLGLVIGRVETNASDFAGLIPTVSGARIDVADIHRFDAADPAGAATLRTLPDPTPIPERDPADTSW